jgi:hypothetical protein
MAKLNPQQKIDANKFSNFAVLDNGFAMAFVKLSIGFSLLRLQLGKGMTAIVWVSIAISVVCNMMVLVGSLFGCRPIQGIWNKAIEADCNPPIVNVVASYIQTTGNIVRVLICNQGYC